MYTAIGKNTKKIYGIAETKSDLIRNLKESYPFQALADGCYPEAILIEKNNTDVNKLNNMNKNELISLMMNYLDNPEIEKFIKATLKTEKKKKKRFRKGVKILVTFPDGNKKEFGSMGLAAREIGINWNTIKYYLIAEKPDKEGRTYERVEESDEKEQE